jgi:hypothetical protein
MLTRAEEIVDVAEQAEGGEGERCRDPSAKPRARVSRATKTVTPIARMTYASK